MRKTALEVVHELAKADRRICFIGSDLTAGTLKQMRAELPGQFFMEGVSEAHIIGMAAGLAMDGKIVYVNTIATFLTRRCFEQLVDDLGLHKARVRLIANGGGLVYAPLGPTHLAIEDIAILRAIPGMCILAPCDAQEMRRLMLQTVDWPGPIYIRVAKGGDPVVSRPDLPCDIGKAIMVRDGRDALVVTTGVTLQEALAAAQQLERAGLAVGVLHLHTIKPFDRPAVLSAVAKAPIVVTVEEHTLNGGLGSAVAELIAEAGFTPAKRFRRLGIPDVFPDKYGSQSDLINAFGFGAAGIVNAVEALAAEQPRLSVAG